MVRRVTALFIALAALAPCAFGLSPQKEGLSAALGERWEDALRLLPSDEKAGRAETYFRALALQNTGMVPESMKIFSSLASTKGSFNGPALERVVAYEFERGNYQKVADAFKASQAQKFLDPDSMNYRVGQSFLLLSQPAEAKKALEAVKGGKYLPYALISQAQMTYAAGDYSGSIQVLDKAMDSLGSHPDRALRKALADEIRLRRGRIIYQAAVTSDSMTKDQREKLLKLAVSQLSLIKDGSPHYAEALRSTGWCSLEMGDKVRALASFETAMAADPENAHEDQWAMGRVFERNEYFEEAADSYATARLTAEEWSITWEGALAGEIAPSPLSMSGGWSSLLDSQASVLQKRADSLGEDFTLVAEAVKLRKSRLDAVEKGLNEAEKRLDAMDAELVKMDGELYQYLDLIQVGSLFPKEERPRIEGLMARQEKLMKVMGWTERALKTISENAMWDSSPDPLRKKVEAMWKKLGEVGSALTQSQLIFLEGLKARVSVREKELMRILESRKKEILYLRTPLKDARRILADERKKLSEMEVKVAALSERSKKAGEGLAASQAEARATLVARTRRTLSEKMKAVKLRGDQIAMDEAQALHLLQTQNEKSGNTDQ